MVVADGFQTGEGMLVGVWHEKMQQGGLENEDEVMEAESSLMKLGTDRMRVRIEVTKVEFQNENLR